MTKREKAKNWIDTAMSAISDQIMEIESNDDHQLAYLLGYLGCCAFAKVLTDRFDFLVENVIPEIKQKEREDWANAFREEIQGTNENLSERKHE